MSDAKPSGDTAPCKCGGRIFLERDDCYVCDSCAFRISRDELRARSRRYDDEAAAERYLQCAAVDSTLRRKISTSTLARLR